MTKTKRRAGPLLTAIAAIALLAAGCGGDSGDGESEAASGASADSSKAAQYSQCMRENGVPNFPDPENGRLMLRAGPNSGIDPNSPQFKSAQEACQSLAPSGGQGGSGQAKQMQAQVLKYARCMRENGVPNFPDPEFAGGRVRMQLPKGVDQNSPQFQSAQQECSELLSELGGAP